MSRPKSCEPFALWGFSAAGGGRPGRRGGDHEAARDGAVALCRFAYQFPALDPAQMLYGLATDRGLGGYTGQLFRRRNHSQSLYGNFIRYHLPLLFYDRLFDFIQGNEELARSIHRFVPWVRTPQDVIRLLDVYLVQTMAKRNMRHQYVGDGRQPTRIAQIATVLGGDPVTEPWLDWQFARCFYYPNPPAGAQDLAISGTDRDGRSPIGSQ